MRLSSGRVGQTMAEGGQSEEGMDIIRVALNSTIPDIDGARILEEKLARLNLVDDVPTCSKLSD